MPGLIEKYNYEVPRYTSYPVITNWKNNIKSDAWLSHISTLKLARKAMSLYVHLPFCESLCTYCGCNKHITTNHSVENPYIDLLLKEWQMYAQAIGGKPILSELHFGGGTPTFFSPKNLDRFLTKLFQNFEIVKNKKYSFEGHPSTTTEGHLAKLAEFGFGRLSIGVQDFNEDILKTINRFQTTNQVYNTVSYARKAGYESINFDLIYGLPGQQLKDIEVSMNHVATLKPERIAFYSYAHVPWTKPAQRAYNESHLPKGKEKRALYERGKELLTQLGYIEIGMDHFSLPQDELFISREEQKLNRNFMGYTDAPSDLMLAIGVSSISEADTAYHQNVKTLKEYSELINEGRLPTLKTHSLDQTEVKTRHHIKALMCQLNTTLEEGDYFDANYLNQMKEEGLLTESEGKWSILPAGLPFVRNIAACFDPQFQRESTIKRFSAAI